MGRKEVDLHRLVARRVPVPEIIHAALQGQDDVGPHVVMRWIEGVTVRELLSRRDGRAIGEAAYSMGATLAQLAAYRWPSRGLLGAGPAVSEPFDVAAFLEICLRAPTLIGRLGPAAHERLAAFIADWLPVLAQADGEGQLVHGDFGGPNLLVRPVEGAWRVVGVLDWEFACAGTPFIDIGHALRYERVSRPREEPHFSRGFLEGGGVLGDDWRAVARAVDLVALCDILTRPSLSEAVADEVVELLNATVESREPA